MVFFSVKRSDLLFSFRGAYTLFLLFLLNITCAHAQTATLLSFKIDDSSLENGRLQFYRPGEIKSIRFTVSVNRSFDFVTNEYVKVSLYFKLVRFANSLGEPIYLKTVQMPLSTSDFTDGNARKSFTVLLTSIGGSSKDDDNYLRTGDKVYIAWGNSPDKVQVPGGNLNEYQVGVYLPDITGNTICCSKCVSPGEEVGLLGQQSGTSISGGDRIYQYQWQGSEDGVNFRDLSKVSDHIDRAKEPSFNPGKITKPTWYRRIVKSSSASNPDPRAPVISDFVKVDFIDAANSPTIGAAVYEQNKDVKAFGTMTISGDQSPVNGSLVNFISDSKIVISSKSKISSRAKLYISPLCGVSSNGRVASFDEILASSRNEEIEPVEIKESSTISIGVYPNPSAGQVVLTLSEPTINKGDLLVINRFSEVVYKVPVDVGTTSVSLDLSSLPADTYYIKINNSDLNDLTARLLLRK